MKFSLKTDSLKTLFFFLQGYSEMKMKINNRGVLEDFKRKLERKTRKRKEKKKRREETEKEKKRKTNFFP